MAKFLLCIICSFLLIQACRQDEQVPQEEPPIILSPADSARLALDSALAAIRDTSYTNSVYYTKTGLASYYGRAFHGRQTANGEVFDTAAFTAAHRTLPFGTTVAVTNPSNNRTILVRINDRGPHHRNRIIDLSKAAARALGIQKKGVGRVKIEARLEKNPPASN